MAEATETVELTEDQKAIRAAELYSDDYTFAEVADVLDCSKSYAQELCRRGILALKQQNQANPVKVEVNPIQVEPSQILYPQLNQRPESFVLETTGIGRRLSLTPSDLMVFDLWKAQGFEGDLSDFVSDCIQYLYQSARPRERGPLLR